MTKKKGARRRRRPTAAEIKREKEYQAECWDGLFGFPSAPKSQIGAEKTILAPDAPHHSSASAPK